MENASASRGLDVVTAVMLGVISVATALGAWQSAIWTSSADQYLDDAADARAVSVNQAVIADYSRRLDLESTVNARRYSELAAVSEAEQAIVYEFRVQSELGRASAGLAEAWEEWSASGFSDSENPIDDPLYRAETSKSTDSYGYVSTTLAVAADERRGQSAILAQAALVQALALFLFGIAAANRQLRVRASVMGFGAAAFIVGLALAATAF